MIKVNSLLDVEIGTNGHRQVAINQVESYAIDTAMDTDADQFSLDIGVPDPDLTFLLHRDNEIRASIFTSGILPSVVEDLHTGFVDVAEMSAEDQILSLNGRDLSALATDSQAPPGEVKWLRPHIFVEKEARALGFSRIKLAQVQQIPKFYRDGGETYWESWYRIYRKRKMWLWTEPDGSLIGDKLNYTASPTYFFGWPHRSYPNANWVNVEACTFRSNKQQRIYETWVFGERGDVGFVAKAQDPTIASWKRKPLKIMTSTTALDFDDALDEAKEEIYESQVGALEITLTIPYSAYGRIIKQNNMAVINIPAMGLSGVFFIVGVSPSGGREGYGQIVRLREKNFALSRRIPKDPELAADPGNQKLPGDVGGSLSDNGIRWGNSFASAAREFHDGWDLATFLGVLLSICKIESGFRNVRGGGDTEWYPKPVGGSESPGGPARGGRDDTAIDTWHRLFANKQHNPLNPRYPSSETAVGPMQLVTPAYKDWADTYGGRRDEYEGGRWMPQANIRAGGRVLAEKLSGLDPKVIANIWIGVKRYYGSRSEAENEAYMRKVKAVFDREFGAKAKAAVSSGQSVGAGAKTDFTVRDANGNPFQVRIPDNAPPQIQRLVNYLIRQLGKPYVWGAEGPNSFDCSGLAVAGYSAAGAPLKYRVTFDIFNLKKETDCVAVTKDNLLAGDMVFFNDIKHMGIYLNDGHFIQAPHTGDVVKISPLNSSYYRSNYEGARRRVSWSGRGRTTGD